MATIRLNRDLRGHIIAGIRRLFDDREREAINRLEALGVARETLALTYGAKITNLAEALYAEAPDWLRTSDSISLVVHVPETGPSLTVPTKVSFTEHLDSLIPVPESLSRQSWGTRLVVPPTHSQYKRCLELAKEVVHITSERKTLIDAVRKILEESTTLQQAHARWGSVLDYVSPGTRTEFYAKAPPRARNSSLSEARKSSLPEEAQVVLLKARMLQR